jgi:hypothetical protein
LAAHPVAVAGQAARADSVTDLRYSALMGS